MDELLEKYPCPRPDSEKFTEYWNMFLVDISDRENLKKSHLQQLKILCSLCVEYDDLTDIIELEGMTYVSQGRNGLQIKAKPEVALRKSCISEIRNYSKMLGLVLVKDTSMTNEKEDTNEFS